jgi:hypothetical protein
VLDNSEVPNPSTPAVTSGLATESSCLAAKVKYTALPIPSDKNCSLASVSIYLLFNRCYIFLITYANDTYICYWRLFKDSLPITLTELTSFEDSNKDFYLSIRRIVPEYPSRVTCPMVGLALAKASQYLEHLSASFIIDAKDFLQYFWPQSLAIIATYQMPGLGIISSL